MRPIIFNVFGFNALSSEIFFMLAIVAGVVIGRSEITRRGMSITPRFYALFLLVTVPLAVYFAGFNSLLFNAFNFNTTYGFEDFANPLSTGLISFGAVLGLLLSGFLFAKIRKHPVAPVLDMISTVQPLILGIYRIGCILTGCCYGKETSSALGVYLPDVFENWATRYPTQWWLMIFDFGLFAILWRWRLKDPPPGALTLAFLLSFSTFRFLVDGFRGDLLTAYGIFNLHQIASLTILLTTLAFMFAYRIKQTRAA